MLLKTPEASFRSRFFLFSAFGDPLVLERAPDCDVRTFDPSPQPPFVRIETCVSPPKQPVKKKVKPVVKWDPAIDSYASSVRAASPGNMSHDSGLFNRSYDFNQSYPSVGTAGRAILSRFLLSPLSRANGLNSLALSGSNPLSPNTNQLTISNNQSLDQSGWSFYAFVRNDTSGSAASRNPHKAVFSIDAKTSRILIANKLGCRLLGVTSDEIATGKVKLKRFINEKKYRAALTEMELDASGDPVVFPGNVVELTSRGGRSVLVSLWVRLLGTSAAAMEHPEFEGVENKPETAAKQKVAVAVAEPVVRADAVIQLSADGKVVWFDPLAQELLDLDEEDHMGKLDVSEILPKLDLEPRMSEDEENQQALVARRAGFGRSVAGSFPVSVTIFETGDFASLCESQEWDAKDAGNFPPAGFDFANGTHVLIVSVYGNLSGLALVDEDGKIVDVNPNFALLTFGRHRDALIGQDVRAMLPTFYRDCEDDDIDSMPLPPMDEPKESNKPPFQSTPLAKGQSKNVDEDMPVDDDSSSGPTEKQRFVDGTYNGTGLHADGTPLNVVYHVQFGRGSAEDPPNKRIYCVWISSATEMSVAGLSESMRKLRGAAGLDASFGGAVSLSTSMNASYGQTPRKRWSFGQYLLSVGQKGRTREPEEDEDSILPSPSLETSKHEEEPAPESKYEQWSSNELGEEDFGEDPDLAMGPYSKRYEILESIGKGAFGCVKLTRRMGRAEGDVPPEEVFVTKFIAKSSVHPSCRVKVIPKMKSGGGYEGLESQWVPAEVDFLLKLDHPNVVKAVEIFSNAKYFQLVMKRHGEAITDLFDFIEKRKTEEMPEDLAHHIFAQMIEALRYLHEDQKIVHRDIKDENVILNERFDAQLIDFGSAAYIPSGKVTAGRPGSLFYTFCGTYQYCSPEVIMGNAYRGPELELWSTGVTLYTMMYKDNPFQNPEEIVDSPLQFPYKVSEPLRSLITGMLSKDPKLRLTLRQCMAHLWMTSMAPWSKKERILSRYSLAEFVEHDGTFDKLPKVGFPPPPFDPLFDAPRIEDVPEEMVVECPEMTDLGDSMNIMTLSDSESSEDSFS